MRSRGLGSAALLCLVQHETRSARRRLYKSTINIRHKNDLGTNTTHRSTIIGIDPNGILNGLCGESHTWSLFWEAICSTVFCHVWLLCITTYIVPPPSLHYNMAHLVRIPCAIAGCNTDFARRADMQRHIQEHHGGPWLCPEAGCSWPGAKRKSRLDAHLQKEHGDIHKGVPLVIPHNFGAPSPVRTQAAQPEVLATGTTTNAYISFNAESSHSHTAGAQSDSVLPVTQDAPTLSPASQDEDPRIWMPAQDPQDYVAGYSSYQHHSGIPGDGTAAISQPPLSFPYGNQFEDTISDQNAPSTGQQGPRGGPNRKERGHYP